MGPPWGQGTPILSGSKVASEYWRGGRLMPGCSWRLPGEPMEGRLCLPLFLELAVEPEPIPGNEPRPRASEEFLSRPASPWVSHATFFFILLGFPQQLCPAASCFQKQFPLDGSMAQQTPITTIPCPSKLRASTLCHVKKEGEGEKDREKRKEPATWSQVDHQTQGTL